jgi:hypothetical protein
LEVFVNLVKKEFSQKIGKYCVLFRQWLAASQKIGSVKLLLQSMLLRAVD